MAAVVGIAKAALDLSVRMLGRSAPHTRNSMILGSLDQVATMKLFGDMLQSWREAAANQRRIQC
jgi:hypothetical protein